MRYKGLGMGREFNSRKPKEAFSYLKSVYGDDLNFPKSNIKIKSSTGVKYVKHSYKPFYESRFYKVIKVGLIVMGVIVLAWEVALKNEFVEGRKQFFESYTLPAYYDYHKEEIKPLIEAVFAKRSELKAIATHGEIWFSNYYYSSSVRKLSTENYEILNFNKEQKATFLDYTLKFDLSAYLKADYILFTFRDDDFDCMYKIIYSKNFLEASFNDEMTYGKLDTNLFWVRTKY